MGKSALGERKKPKPSSKRRARLQSVFQGLLRRVPLDRDGVARVGARQIYILPTGAGVFYAAVVLSMVLGSLNFQNNLGLFFGFFLTGVGLIAMHRCWFNLLGLEVQVRAGPPVFAGSPAQFEVVLRNERSSSRSDLRAVGTGKSGSGIHLDSHDQQSLSLSIASERRGLLRLPVVEIETRHPMHLFRAWCLADSAAACLIYPRPADLAPPASQDAGDARRRHRSKAEGSEDFLGPREYRRGDSLRRLDWKALARERGLMIKQFGAELGGSTWIDWSDLESGDPERRIALLARQVLDAAQTGQRFGLRLPGVEIPLDRGETQAHRCLETLALFDRTHANQISDRRSP